MAPPELPEALAGLRDLLQRNLSQFTANLQRTGNRMAAACQQALMPLQTGSAPLLASVSARLGSVAAAAAPVARAARPLFDLAFNPEEIKARLHSVPVYAVVNSKNEFVLVAGDEDASKQLGLFFFSQAEAEALLKTIKAANPKLGKTAKVLTTSMDLVYDFATTPRSDTDTEGVVFRFVPDPRQIENALELYRHAGVPAAGFQGVPLFQAEGLTIKGDKARYTPLFFSKDDLDAALGAAYSGKESAAQADTRAKAEQAAGELAEARAQVEAAGSDRDRKAAQRRADQAAQRLQKYEQRLEQAEASKKLPRVDVGSLEEVLGRMEADEKGEWDDVVFIPSNSVLGGSNVPEPPAPAPAAKGKAKAKK